jgi:hypothetical protein
MTGGRISNEIIQSCKDFLDFTRCERPDGSAYGTGGKCRKGVEADKVETLTKILGMPADQYAAEYYPKLQKMLEDEANEFLARINDLPPEKRSAEDAVRMTAAKRLNIVLEDIREYSGNAKVVAALKGTKEMFDDMKWRITPKRVFISEETLRLAWQGVNPSAKARDLFPDMDTKFGQSKVSIGEHAFPTSILKTQLISKQFNKPQDLAAFVLKRNFITWVGAPENSIMDGMGYKQRTPDQNNVFARYAVSGIKAYPVTNDPKIHSIIGGKAGLQGPRLTKMASEAKAQGQSFEEWAATIIDL